ncbi:MAG: hypothetical protein E7233_07035 [Lachnospiraceae bacterium]|nr:hypothetical protein [Lachnospiraceae bacterium]
MRRMNADRQHLHLKRCCLIILWHATGSGSLIAFDQNRMKKTVLITTIAIIFFLLVLQQSTFAYDEGEVICTISSFITGVKSQGALYSETALGDFAADALREAGKTDIAVVNGGDLIHVLDQGPVTYGEVVDVFTENKPVAIAVVTAEDIWDMLEHGVENIVLGEDEKTDKEASVFDGFPQISGIRTQYDIAAPKGSRIKYLYIGEVPYNRHDSYSTFTLCATEEMLSGSYGYKVLEYESTGKGLADCLADYLKSGDHTASTVSTDRIKVQGSKDKPLFPRGVLFLVGLFLCLCSYLISKAKRRADPDRSLNSYVDPDR